MRCLIRSGQVILDDMPLATSISRIFCTSCLALFRGVLQYVSESGDSKQKPNDVLVHPAASDSTVDSIILRT